ncbi:MAG: hypothetical protein ABSC06_13090 [Rhodopila sp.]
MYETVDLLLRRARPVIAPAEAEGPAAAADFEAFPGAIAVDAEARETTTPMEADLRTELKGIRKLKARRGQPATEPA